MKPVLPLVACAAALIAISVTVTPTSQAQTFATNTPAQPNRTQPAPTDNRPATTAMLPAAFPTNTRYIEEPTDPPTPTRTASLTPSPTFTPSLTPTFTPSPTQTPTFTPTPNGPNSYPEGISSLTGLPFPNEEAMNRRNVLIKISNYPPVVRPQSGLNQADIVYEYEVEGGVTRFAAIYRSQSPRHVGPVRSGRLMDSNLVPMYQAIFSYSGASQPVQQYFFDQPWSVGIISPSIGDNCREAGFCRFPSDGLAFEHTLYADTEMIWARATGRGINEGRRARGFAFSETPDANGTPANELAIDWYGQTDARWQWDATAGRYVRYTDSVAHYDALDGEQLWADNIVVIEVPHEERPDLFEEESRSASQQINLWGSGRAYLFRDGVYYEGYWNRPCDAPPENPTATPEGNTTTAPCGSEPGSALYLNYGNNIPMLMRPGRTYVEVVRYLGETVVSGTLTNVRATETVLAQSVTPTRTLTPGTAPTAEATRAD